MCFVQPLPLLVISCAACPRQSRLASKTMYSWMVGWMQFYGGRGNVLELFGSEIVGQASINNCNGKQTVCLNNNNKHISNKKNGRNFTREFLS